MKAGADYERFVFEKLKLFFVDGVVVLNDKIPGHDSGLDREIGVSVRLKIGDTELLYIVQCKDWKSRVDINTLGALSAVMIDVMAAKGFMLCTSGFYKTNFQYALTKGIELITIEDIKSDKWTTEIQIPIIYIRKRYSSVVRMGFIANEALVVRNRDRDISLEMVSALVRTNDGQPDTTLDKYILKRVRACL